MSKQSKERKLSGILRRAVYRSSVYEPLTELGFRLAPLPRRSLPVFGGRLGTRYGGFVAAASFGKQSLALTARCSSMDAIGSIRAMPALRNAASSPPKRRLNSSAPL